MIYIVCEGAPAMLDPRVIDLIVNQKSHKNVKIAAAGGDLGLRSVARWIEHRSFDEKLQKNLDQAYVIVDRNFRPLGVAEQTWNDPTATFFIWRRHEIENYQLEPRVVAEAFAAIKKSGTPKYDHLPTDETEIVELLQRLAAPLLENYVGWLTWNDLVGAQKQCDTNLKGPTSPSKKDRAAWIDYCRTECQRLKVSCDRLIKDTRFEIGHATKIYDQYWAEVTKTEFFDRQIFVRDLGGHELLSQLLQYLNNQQQMPISRSLLEEELIQALDRVYQPGFFTPDDFKDLAERLP